jgi:hypothetical protein
MPVFYLIDEMKYAIVSPNTDFDQLKRDLETLSCGKKFLNGKDPSYIASTLSSSVAEASRL